ncbi:hypothetical protein M0R45_029995 [Rubus argutus]|uniref:Uncharacterized protein n=1 Tax=Rubus argutus TaxID=59490 RepID=A0AAW1WC86_RUBAR
MQAQAERKKASRKASQMELNDAIYQIERKGKFYHEFSNKELTDLNLLLKEKMDRTRQLIDYCEKNPHPVALEVGEAYEHIMSQIG